MGNAAACLLAHKMGMPLERLIIATNENDVAVKYYQTGVYTTQKTAQTLSNAMDIGNPSNFERLLDLFKDDHAAFRKLITAVRVSDAQTVAAIQKVYKKEKYLMEFHTAVAYSAAEKAPQNGVSTVVISPASPVKFAKEMEKETGITIDNSRILKNLRMKKKRVVKSKNDYASIKKLLLGKLY